MENWLVVRANKWESFVRCSLTSTLFAKCISLRSTVGDKGFRVKTQVFNGTWDNSIPPTPTHTNKHKKQLFHPPVRLTPTSSTRVYHILLILLKPQSARRCAQIHSTNARPITSVSISFHWSRTQSLISPKCAQLSAFAVFTLAPSFILQIPPYVKEYIWPPSAASNALAFHGEILCPLSCDDVQLLLLRSCSLWWPYFRDT